MTPDPPTAAWKQQLLTHCATTIQRLPDNYLQDCPPLPPEEMSLYEMQEQLVSLRSEMRTVNRRTVDALGTFSDLLSGMREDSTKIREQLSTTTTASESLPTESQQHARALIHLGDRIQRMLHSLTAQAQQQDLPHWTDRLPSRARRAPRPDLTQHLDGLNILHDSLHKLLHDLHIQRIPLAPGDAFDPLIMKAVGQLQQDSAQPTPGAALIINEELLAGYMHHDHCLRPAEVTLTTTA